MKKIKSISKKFLSIFLAVMVGLGVSPININLPDWLCFNKLFSVEVEAISYSGTCGDDISWTLDTSTGVLEIEGSGMMTDFECQGAPWYGYVSEITNVIISYGITKIGDYAFYCCDKLVSIFISETVTEIGNGAFYWCNSIEIITIPNTVKSIGYGAFAGCDSLKNINIPENITSIEGHTFSECVSLTSIVIPSNVKSIDDYAFIMCTSLETVLLEDGVVNIGYGSFAYCTNLEYVHMPSTTTAIGNDIFYDCSAYICSDTDVCYAKEYAEENNIEFSICDNHSENVMSGTCGEDLYWNFNSDTGVLDISGSGSMWSYFDDNPPWQSFSSSIEVINLPEGLISIGEFSFTDCTNLESIKIPNSVVDIGWCAFKGCSSLSSVEFGNSVEEIGDSAFYGCTALESIVFPDSVLYVWDSSFDGCLSLTSVSFGENITTIGYQAFKGDIALESVSFPAYSSKHVIQIDSQAFVDCTDLLSITLPDNVERIGTSAFYNTGYYNNENNWENDALYIDGCLVSVNAISGDYKIKSGTRIIAGGVFAYCSDMTSIEFPLSVSYIGDSAFRNCTSLKEVVIPYGVEIINDHTFADCTGLESIQIPESVTVIGAYAFSDCENIRKVTIPNSVEEILYGAFSSCTNIEEIIIPDSVTTIGNYVFKDCISLVSIDIGDSVTSVGESAFDNTGYYNNDANWENDVLYLNNHLLKAKPTLSGTYEIRFGVKTISSLAFDSCKELISISIPDTVVDIGYGTFYNCSNLTFIIIPDSVTEIDMGVFYQCDALEYVHVPASVEYIDWSAFFETSAYICSDTNSCYAKDFAEEEGIEFKNCSGQPEEHVCVYDIITETEASCTESGEILYECVCGNSYIEEISATGHNFSEWTIISEPTMTENGVKTRICYNCDLIETGSVPKTGITVILISADGKIVKEVTISGDKASISFDKIDNGEYTVTVSKTTCTTRSYFVSAEDGEVTLEFELCKNGDLTGDGKVNTIDVAFANAHAKGVKVLEGYTFACADVNGDGKVNTIDVARINAHAKGVTVLW